MSFRVASARDCGSCQKCAKHGFCSISTKDGRHRTKEVKLPTIWTDEKQSRAEAERRERSEERRSEKRKSQKKEDGDARKGGNIAIHCVFLNNLWLRRVEK